MIIWEEMASGAPPLRPATAKTIVIHHDPDITNYSRLFAVVKHAEPWAFVISTNLHRRHLSDAQRAMIAGRIAERHRGEYERKPNPSDEGFGDQPPTREQARTMLNVSHGSLARAAGWSA